MQLLWVGMLRKIFTEEVKWNLGLKVLSGFREMEWKYRIFGAANIFNSTLL